MDGIVYCLLCGKCSAYVDLDNKLQVSSDKPFCEVYGNSVPIEECDKRVPKTFDFVYALKLLKAGRVVWRPSIKGDYIVGGGKNGYSIRITTWCSGYEDIDIKPYKFTAEDIAAEDWQEVFTDW